MHQSKDNRIKYLHEKLARQNWQEWVGEHAKRLNAPTDTSTEDLTFLQQTLKDNRIVLLGESTHGSTEMNQSKIRMIKYLHEELDYDVLAFEAGFAETNAVYQNLDNLTAEQAMKQAIYGVWFTEEVEELFQYMKEQKEKGDPLILTGFDMQVPWNSSTAPFASFAKEWIGKVNPEIANVIQEAESEIVELRDAPSYEVFKEKKQPVLDKYERVKEFVQHHKAELLQVAPSKSYDVNLLEQTINIRIDTINTYIENDKKIMSGIPPENVTDIPFYLRDQKMAENLLWLSEEQFKNEKIIVWGHNYHIRKQNSKMIQDFTNTDGYAGPNMIDFIPDFIKDQMYSIGVFAYSGSSLGSDNQSVFPVSEKHEANSIEEILKAGQHPQVFVNLKGEKNHPGTSWMFSPIKGKYWGFVDEIMIPNQQYDGILWLEHITPSHIK
ncbi:erythromycin esterase family protein [Bacillus sp. FJAT-52991]|uniref:Erythromycin esterase family protein n=2 Tax=Bacillus kandeliae TaxID=3129297 RepID=A0ABZ2NAQ2_9BACI